MIQNMLKKPQQQEFLLNSYDTHLIKSQNWECFLIVGKIGFSKENL